jgi:hypothetical protein
MAKQDKEYYKKYCEENKFKISERKRLYYEQKKNDILEKQKKYYNENSELIKEREKKKYKDNIEESRKRGRDYYENNKEKFLTKQKERYDIDGAEKIKKRRLSDPIFKLKSGIGNRLRDFLKQNGYNKNKKTFQTIGCTPQELRFFLEKKFKVGMSWDNHGEWHIDHIIPLSSAKTEEEVYKLNHYTNLQPLWKEENLSKGNKILK